LQVCESVARKVPFVFAYILDEDEQKRNEIHAFAKRHNLPCIIKSAGHRASGDDTIQEWLSYFRDARYIIADSFHGTVFSILFNKDFMVYSNHERGNSRFISLLECFNLSNRLTYSLPMDIDGINWEDVNTIHNRLRYESIEWLKTNLTK
jgi:hypothetical protein